MSVCNRWKKKQWGFTTPPAYATQKNVKTMLTLQGRNSTREFLSIYWERTSSKTKFAKTVSFNHRLFSNQYLLHLLTILCRKYAKIYEKTSFAIHLCYQESLCFLEILNAMASQLLPPPRKKFTSKNNLRLSSSF
jgi:hypothetical protein